MNKIAYVLALLGIILMISGAVTSFLSGLREDKELTYSRMADVSDSYEEFSTEVSLFEDYRDNLYEKYLANLTYDTMSRDDAIIKKELSNYEEMVDSIFNKSKTLSKLCDDVYYPESSVNNKCSNYRTIYEQVNNFFVLDIKTYNSNIKKYNSNNTNSLKNYKTDKDYIDYNEDGTIEGKDE